MATIAATAPTAEADVLAVRRCLSGDKESFRELVERYKRRAYFVALQLVGNMDDAMEISQEAFIRAYKNLKGFDTTRPFPTWFFTILRNLCIDHLRARRPGVALEAVEGTTQARHRGAGPEALTARNRLKERVWTAVNALPHQYREVIVLKDLQGLKYVEISKILDIPMGTVQSRLHEARKQLKGELEDML